MNGKMRGMGIACALVLAACGGATEMPAADRPERLAGGWAAEFRLVVPLQLRADPARAGTLRGELLLAENRLLPGDPDLAGPPTHYGAYTLDFRPFGFGAPAREVPTVAARLVGADSVEAVLRPSGVRLAGTLRGDSVSGRWSYAGDRYAGAAGRFVLRRIPPPAR